MRPKREVLVELYEKQHWGVTRIAKKFKVHPVTVFNWLLFYSIKTKRKVTAKIKKQRTGAVLKCKCCGNEFYIQRYKIKLGRKYCSRECFLKDRFDKKNEINSSKKL